MITFIVLHYKNIEDTIKCLKLISKYKSHIVLVDNNTLNENDEKLIKQYTIDIIKLDKNYGFARANNCGIKYAKEKYNPKFYCVINNDVFVTQKEFLEKIKSTYEKFDFDVLGPKIESSSGESINPFPVIYGKDNLKREIKKCKKLIFIYKSSLLTYFLNKYINRKKVIKNKENGKKIQLNVALHGCALIFSSKYIHKYENAFDNRTFLFHEEEFLYKRIKNDNLISIYNPNIKVFHQEGSSLKKENQNYRKSKLFKEKERLKSLNILYRE